MLPAYLVSICSRIRTNPLNKGKQQYVIIKLNGNVRAGKIRTSGVDIQLASNNPTSSWRQLQPQLMTLIITAWEEEDRRSLSCIVMEWLMIIYPVTNRTLQDSDEITWVSTLLCRQTVTCSLQFRQQMDVVNCYKGVLQ